MPKKDTKKKSNAGRKSQYKENILDNWDMIKQMAEDGFTDKDIYNKLCISHDTFYVYVKKYPEFAELLKASRFTLKEIALAGLKKNAQMGERWAVEKILNMHPEFAITPKDEKYFEFKEREIKTKEKANEIEEQKIEKVIGTDPIE